MSAKRNVVVSVELEVGLSMTDEKLKALIAKVLKEQGRFEVVDVAIGESSVE